MLRRKRGEKSSNLVHISSVGPTATGKAKPVLHENLIIKDNPAPTAVRGPRNFTPGGQKFPPTNTPSHNFSLLSPEVAFKVNALP